MSLHEAPEELFWYWISERHAIFLRRQRGQPKPWTTDPILRDYKFTNPFRENDRGTVWLRENFLEPHRKFIHNDCCASQGFIGGQGLEFIPCDCSEGEKNLSLLAFNICWYRMFNWWGTGKLLGWRESWPIDVIKEILDVELRNQRQVFTGAHIVYSPPGISKVEAITNVCAELWKRREEIARVARRTRSLQLTFDTLTLVHCVGGFMAYEMVTDMRHTRLLEDARDIMTWANPGPGARRGLQRLGLPSKGASAIESMRKLLSRARYTQEVSSEFGALFAVPMFPVFEMRDIEHSLCEFDKYCRVKFGEGQPRSKFAGVA